MTVAYRRKCLSGKGIQVVNNYLDKNSHILQTLRQRQLTERIAVLVTVLRKDLNNYKVLDVSYIILEKIPETHKELHNIVSTYNTNREMIFVIQKQFSNQSKSDSKTKRILTEIHKVGLDPPLVNSLP